MKASHRNTFDSIPWLVTGRVDDDERQSFEKHLTECAECRAELDEQQRIHAAINRETPRVDYAPGASLQKLWTRIGESEHDAPVPAPVIAMRANSKFRMRLTHWLAAAVVVEAVGLTFMASQGPALATRDTAAYRTVTDATTERSGAVVRIVFAPDVAVSEVNTLLRKERLIVVNGPTPAGVYTLASTKAPADLPSGVQQTLEALRAHPGVRFAEPIGAPAVIDTGTETEKHR